MVSIFTDFLKLCDYFLLLTKFEFVETRFLIDLNSWHEAFNIIKKIFIKSSQLLWTIQNFTNYPMQECVRLLCRVLRPCYYPIYVCKYLLTLCTSNLEPPLRVKLSKSWSTLAIPLSYHDDENFIIDLPNQ